MVGSIALVLRTWVEKKSLRMEDSVMGASVDAETDTASSADASVVVVAVVALLL